VVERLLNPKNARYPSHNPRRLKPKSKNPVSEWVRKEENTIEKHTRQIECEAGKV
jgi:hypothetical protein